MKMLASATSFWNCSKFFSSRSSSRMYPEHSTATSGWPALMRLHAAESELVLRLEHHVDDLEDLAVTDLVGDDAAILRVALREQARAARRHHARLLRRAREHRAAVLLLLLLRQLILELLLDPLRLRRDGGCEASANGASVSLRRRGQGAAQQMQLRRRHREKRIGRGITGRRGAARRADVRERSAVRLRTRAGRRRQRGQRRVSGHAGGGERSNNGEHPARHCSPELRM